MNPDFSESDEWDEDVTLWRQSEEKERLGLLLGSFIGAVSLALSIWRFHDTSGWSWSRIAIVVWIIWSGVAVIFFAILFVKAWQRERAWRLSHPPQHSRRSRQP